MISTFELFRIGIGPSSSHTVGPMRAAARFVSEFDARMAAGITELTVELHGSLAATGVGHGTPDAVLLGLEGFDPETVNPVAARRRVAEIRASRSLLVRGRVVPMDPDVDISWHLDGAELLAHPNAMTLTAMSDGLVLRQQRYYSVGGGSVLEDSEVGAVAPAIADEVPHPFASGDELLAVCSDTGLSVAQVMLANETALRPASEIDQGLDRIWEAMRECVAAGLAADGVLPGVLKVPRRAPGMHRKLLAQEPQAQPWEAMDQVMLHALAVNEENAAGGRVVTAPTNGAAGIIPAVLHHFWERWPGADIDGVREFLLTAAAVGSIIKRNASISGAEVGCQGEVGSACAMAAAGLAAVMGGTAMQVENAAEIGMEHNLGLTCDPVAGLVQIPCIERNSLAAVKAIAAARTAMHGDGHHLVSLDEVVATMRETGMDMLTKYKETSRGGLAVNVIEC